MRPIESGEGARPSATAVRARPGAAAGSGSPGVAGRPRPHEIVAAAYFALTGLFVAAWGAPLSAWWPTLLLHAGAVALALGILPRLPERSWSRVVRDWLPPVAMTFVYLEVGRLNDLFVEGYFDREILRLEAALFDSQPSVVLREWLPWKPLSEYLHFGYFTYYALGPALGGSLYLQRRYAEYRYLLTVGSLVFFTSYLCFILFPVAGPWYVFDRPDPDRMGWLFPQMEHLVLARAASIGAAFPSSHVAAAVAFWLLAWQLSRQVFWVFTAIVPALVVGTVYGGFHYAVDALAGVLMGLAAWLAGPAVHRALGGGDIRSSPTADPASSSGSRHAGTTPRGRAG